MYSFIRIAKKGVKFVHQGEHYEIIEVNEDMTKVDVKQLTGQFKDDIQRGISFSNLGRQVDYFYNC